jgi:hypothetical protein
MKPVDQFIAACGNLAQKFGIQLVIIAVRDASGETRTVSSPGAKEALGTVLADKLGLAGADESETAWS